MGQQVALAGKAGSLLFDATGRRGLLAPGWFGPPIAHEHR